MKQDAYSKHSIYSLIGKKTEDISNYKRQCGAVIADLVTVASIFP
jgi:hypothetical protein